ncbi:Peroxin 13, N-terminal region-domain-containing protein [Roridomyces roridus]|uniref:Peroxisomal membrane protein PEX13 n=1 Tax=Roridomyces roridus TaxID=1738132 RepID=A0AAD7F5G7_9AGAR|nr:Peroxin 13, N-terminal region-domain-containing protein [Roridomyces roridus]
MPPPLDANGMPIPTLTQTLESTTQHTFALLHSIVQTFSGVAQMLESTFMATHSSFFAMVGVIDQFGHLRNALGSVLGIFGLIRGMRELVTGTPARPAMQGEYRDFINGRPVQGPHPRPPKPSKKPLSSSFSQSLPLPPLDPASLTFARALYPFTTVHPSELPLKENEIVAIMAKLDPRTGNEHVEEWWKGRTREGREGWFPRKWVEVLEKKEKKID